MEYRVRKFQGWDFSQLNDVVTHFANVLVENLSPERQKYIKEHTRKDEEGNPILDENGNPVLDEEADLSELNLSVTEKLEASLDLDEIKIIVLCGTCKKDADINAANNRMEILIPVDKMDYVELYEAYDEVMRVNADFFIQSLGKKMSITNMM